MTRKRYDVVVVGAGSGGYAAARTARDGGAEVALVDRGPLGGLCILRGCMPSKALIASSDALHDAREAEALGVKAASLCANMPFIAARKRGLIKSFADYRTEGIRAFPLYEGAASFLSPTELLVSLRKDDRLRRPASNLSSRAGEEGGVTEALPSRARTREEAADVEGSATTQVVLEAKNFIIATGSVIATPTVPGLAEVGALDSDAILELERIPESVVVLGGGYTACELGQFLSRMGARTTMIIRSGQLLTYQDADVGTTLTQSFAEEGVEVIKHAKLLSVERRGTQKVVRCAIAGSSVIPSDVEGSASRVMLADGTQEIAADEIFNALGRTPDVTGLNLEAADVAYDRRNGITVDGTLRTSNPNIFAVGDVNGQYLLVHVAIYQGEVAARNALDGGMEIADYRTMSAHTIFCDPQVARVGKSEKELQAEETPYVVGRYDFAEHGKAMCLGKTKGFVKMMADRRRGEILGATVIGAQASELIHEMIVAMHYHATADEFMRIPHLHPTLAEIWTYPAEECCAQLGMKKPGDEQIELATSAT